MKSLVDFINESTINESNDDKKYVEKMLKKYKINLDDKFSMQHLAHEDDYEDDMGANDYVICYNRPDVLKYIKQTGSEIIAKGKDMVVVSIGEDWDDDEMMENNYSVNYTETIA